MPDENVVPTLGGAGPIVSAAPSNTVWVENLLAPEIFADAGIRCTADGVVAKITLISGRWDNSVQPPRFCEVVVGRLTMPIEGAERMATVLFDFLKQHKAKTRPASEPRMQ